MANPGDYFLVGGVVLVGTGVHFLLPAATPWYILGIGVVMSALGGVAVWRGRKRR